MTDPYKILGVQRSASNDEIKKAYRELSKKYHPDSYMNNPLSELAEERFKEIQQAYDQVMKEREGGFSGTSYTQNSDDNGSEMNTVYSYLNSRRYADALNILSGLSNRDARWYYLSAVAHAGIGDNLAAYNHAQEAVRMEPGNRDYVNLFNQLQWQNNRYQTRGYGNGRTTVGTGNLCCDLWCADTLCECMGGDLCSCC